MIPQRTSEYIKVIIPFLFLLYSTTCEVTFNQLDIKPAEDFHPSKYVLPDKCYGPQEQLETTEDRRRRSLDNVTSSISNLEMENETETEDPFLARFSEEFLTCGKIFIDYGCYYLLSNGSSFVYNRLFNESDYIIRDDEDWRLYVCSHYAIPMVKFEDVFGLLTEIGLGISITCVILHMIMFVLVPQMRNLPGYCMFSLCIALLIAYLCFLAQTFMEADANCMDLGMLRLYFFLASFFWMNVLSYDIWRSLRMATAKLRLTTHVWWRFAMYSLYAWGSALFVVVTALIVDSLGDVDEKYKLHFRVDSCWFTYKQALLVYFAMPLFVMVILNLLFFIWSFLMITSASMKNVQNRGVLWSRLCIFLKLFIIMGLTWILGAIAIATNEKAMWYLFLIANTMQGVLIFFSSSFGEKAKKAWRTYFRARKISATPTQISFHSQHVVTTV